MTDKIKYNSIDGLRAYSAIGIVLMHVLDNGNYEMDGFVFDKFIPSFTDFVFLFMIISCFSMCCGYYDKIVNNNMSIEVFYSKRYKKIWPYFALLCVLDVLISPSVNAFYELFANLTLCFGLLPNANISVIGVGWFLGIVFLFYLLFPFICCLLSNKKRAWFSFVVALIFNILCSIYFFDNSHVVESFTARTNFLYCAVFFLAGGLIFLYKEDVAKINKKYSWIFRLLLLVMISIYYFLSSTSIIRLLLFSLILMTVITDKKQKVFDNSVTRFLSEISMEIYLSHMVVYRVLEKINLTHLFKSEIMSYLVAVIGTILGVLIFVIIIRFILKKGVTIISSLFVRGERE